jgi:hypothetical protein
VTNERVAKSHSSARWQPVPPYRDAVAVSCGLVAARKMVITSTATLVMPLNVNTQRTNVANFSHPLAQVEHRRG